MASALAGVTVLELSRVLAGPWCGMLLADLGAEVIKIESPDGDETRQLGPPFMNGLSAYFASCNRNKKSLVLDLASPASRPLLEALVRSADVLIENYRTGTAEALGVGYESMSGLNPRLVYCAISGYGRTGPDARRPGYDFAIQAEAGLMSITGDADGPAQKVGVAVADLATGQNAAIAILAALRHRDATGLGQFIDISLFDTQLSWLANVGSSVLFTGSDAGRYGNAHSSIVPYQAFRASDGEFVLAVANEKLWALTCQVVGREDWAVREDYAGNPARVAHRARLAEELGEIFARDTVAAWLARLQSAGVPCAPINSVRHALDHPLVAAREMRVELGGYPLTASPMKFSRSPVEYRDPPPQLGEHNEEITARFLPQGALP